MSRIGKQPVVMPDGVTATVNGQSVSIKGPKGELPMDVHPLIKVNLEGNALIFERTNDEKFTRSLHGTIRSLANNIVVWVTKGYTKALDIIGVGYQARMQGTAVELIVGLSHPVILTPPVTVTVELPNPTQISLSSPDKQAIGEFAARIRRVRPPEPYKGKGIKYRDEVIRRKAGKAFVGGE